MKVVLTAVLAVTLAHTFAYSGEMRYPRIGGGGSASGLSSSVSCDGSSVNIDSGTLYVDCNSNTIGLGTTSPTSTLVIRSTTGQSTNMQEWQNAAGTALANIDKDGQITTPYVGFTAGYGFTAGGDGHVFLGSRFNGFALQSGTGISLITNGSYTSTFYDNSYRLKDTYLLGWTDATSYFGTVDVILGRSSANNLRLGNVAANPPVAQTLSVQNASGTNIAGSSTTIAGSAATGNATGGSLHFQTSDAGASGTTLQSLTTKMAITAGGRVGISTISPSYPLHVVGDSYASGQGISGGSVTVQGDAFSVGGSTLVVTGGFVAIGGTGAATKNSVIRLNSSNNFMTIVATAAATISTGHLGFGSAAPHTPGTKVLTWTDGSRVGVGTSIPADKLHISSGTLVIDGSGSPTKGSALCLTAAGLLGACDGLVGADGTCTCTSP